jgi:hypothetical protein
MLSLLANEPSLVSGFVAAAIMLAVAFGVPISDTEKSAILGFVGAALAIVAAFVARSQVTPNAQVSTTTTTTTVPKGP